MKSSAHWKRKVKTQSGLCLPEAQRRLDPCFKTVAVEDPVSAHGDRHEADRLFQTERVRGDLPLVVSFGSSTFRPAFCRVLSTFLKSGDGFPGSPREPKVSKQQTANSKQQTTNNKQQTTNNPSVTARKARFPVVRSRWLT